MNNKEHYKSICGQQPDLPVFLQHWWLDAVCSKWDAAIVNKGDHIAGVWPYAIDKKAGVSILRNPRLTPYLGPTIFLPPDIKASNKDSFEYETTAELLQQIPDCKVWNLSVKPGFKQAGILKNKGLAIGVQQTFIIDLSADESELFSNLKESLRRNIRAAEKEITIVDAPEYISDLYHFQKYTLSGKGVMQAYTLSDMQRLMAACREHNSCALWLAKSGETVLASVWNVWDHRTSYYYMGAQNPGTESYKAMSLLLWHSIKEAKSRGNELFDLEGSMDPGVERFFRGFGGTRELYMILKKNTSRIWKFKEFMTK